MSRIIRGRWGAGASRRSVDSRPTVQETSTPPSLGPDQTHGPQPAGQVQETADSSLQGAADPSVRDAGSHVLQAEGTGGGLDPSTVSVVREVEAALRTSAYQEGYQQGLEEGRAAGRQEVISHIQLVARIAEEARASRWQLLHSVEAEVVELAIEVARKIIGDELAANPRVVASIVATAVQKVARDQPVKVRLNPADVEVLGSYWAEAFGPADGDLSWVVVADRRVKPGGCIIDTRAGSIDAQIDTQLGFVKRAFQEVGGLD